MFLGFVFATYSIRSHRNEQILRRFTPQDDAGGKNWVPPPPRIGEDVMLSASEASVTHDKIPESKSALICFWVSSLRRTPCDHIEMNRSFVVSLLRMTSGKEGALGTGSINNVFE
jgi:hypothetical protein